MSDVPDATKWVDDLRGDDESEQEPVAWKPVVGYEEFYEVSSVGDLRDTKTKKIKSKSLMGAGYVKADLWANGARKQTSMHRLVAEAFLIPKGNANEVNHKNGIKTDNRVENLEWVTRSDNVNHSYYKLNNQVKPIFATHIETGNTLYYPSVEAAVRDGFCSAHISSVIAGRRKHHKGFVFIEAAPPSKPDDVLRQSEQEGWRWAKECEAEVKRLRTLLAEGGQGCCECGVTVSEGYALYCVKCVEPLFKKEWVSLTDEVLFNLWVKSPAESEDRFAFVKAVMAELKEKNT